MIDLGSFSGYPGYKVYGNYVSLVCPYHEDTKPSLLAFRDGWFTCMACDMSGSLEQLQRKLEGVDTRLPYSSYSPADYLPRVGGSTLDEYEIYAETAHVLIEEFPEQAWYLKMRGVDSRILPNRLGWADGWYTFPVYSRDLLFKGFVMRASPDVEYRTGLRYFIPQGQRPNMFVPDWRLLDVENRIFVVYGILDALALSVLRFPVVTTSGGKSSFNADWLQRYRKRIVIIPDKGEEQTAYKLARDIGYRAKVAKLPYPAQMKDPADFLAAGKGRELQCLLTSL